MELKQKWERTEEGSQEDDVPCATQLLDKLAVFPADGDSSVFCCPFIRSLRIAYISQFSRFIFSMPCIQEISEFS